MKRKAWIAACVFLLAGMPAQARAVEWEIRDVTHTVTAGDGKFLLDGRAIDVPEGAGAFLKGGAVMLPAEPLLRVLNEKTVNATVNEDMPPEFYFGGYRLLFDTSNNIVYATNTEVKLADGMEARGGQVYISMRGWRDILAACGYLIGEDAVSWDAKTRTATLCFSGQELEIIGEGEPPAPAGKGVVPEYVQRPSQKYEVITNLGGGYFSAQYIQPERGRDILDSAGTVRQSYGPLIEAQYLGENRFLLSDYGSDGRDELVVDENGEFVFSVGRRKGIYPFSEGLAKIRQDGRIGFVDAEGRLVIPAIYSGAEDFSDGLALVSKEGKRKYIDKNGNALPTAEYDNDYYQSFREGLAAVRDKEGKWGYIDTTGREAIPTQYDWAGDFCGGRAFVRDKSNGKDQTWTIDRTGKRLELVAENKTLVPMSWDYGEAYAGMMRAAEDVTFAGGRELVTSIYTADGEIPYEKARWLTQYSEGLMAYRDEETGKWGYVDEAWNWAVAPVFDHAEPFSDGYAVVWNQVKQGDAVVDSAWGIIKRP